MNKEHLLNLYRRLFSRKAFFFLVILGVVTGKTTAQEQVYFEMESMTLQDGKYVKVLSEILFDLGNGQMITHYTYPKDYYLLKNEIGEAKIYNPIQNTLSVQYHNLFSTKGALIYLFLKGGYDDLGFKELGFELIDTRFEDEVMVSKWIPSNELLQVYSEVELVLKDQYPIYCGYYAHNGEILEKTYYSEYKSLAGSRVPMRITQVSYTSPTDSIVTRTRFYNTISDDTISKEIVNFSIPGDVKILD